MLKKIIEYKKIEVEICKKKFPFQKLLQFKFNEHRSLLNAIKNKSKLGIFIIGEIKRASPSRGIIIKNGFNPVKIAKKYQKSGVIDAISVLTDEKFFMGRIDFLPKIRKVVSLPLLRKDFIIDEYQIYEAKYFGADAILLIAAILDDEILKYFLNIAKELFLDVIVEVHTEKELKRILKLDADMIGINNRDLNTFKVDIETTVRLAKKVPNGKIIISESGMKTRDDINKMADAGADAVLIGEYIESIL